VIVQDKRHVVGVVTDRDLALRVVGYELDPRTTTLAEIMSEDVATLPIVASETEAIELMRERRVRRVPLLDGDKVVGLVTVDDLLIEGTLDPHDIAEAVRAQLVEPSQLKPRGTVFPTEPVYGRALSSRARRESGEERVATRHAARAEETFGRLVHRVQTMTGLETRDLAATALEVVLVGVVRRIMPQEAADLIAQLPSILQERLLDLPAGPDRGVTRESIERDLAQRLDLDPDRAARIVTDVGAALEQAVSAGEIESVRGQLPREMRGIFPVHGA
jgi:uncharacterized protein (DUF2267 family)